MGGISIDTFQLDNFRGEFSGGKFLATASKKIFSEARCVVWQSGSPTIGWGGRGARHVGILKYIIGRAVAVAMQRHSVPWQWQCSAAKALSVIPPHKAENRGGESTRPPSEAKSKGYEHQLGH